MWKKIPLYEGYSISDFAEVRNDRTKLILKQFLRNGYKSIGLYKDRKCHFFVVHSLMVRVFCDNWDKSLVACHMDGNKLNNELSNIKLLSQKENMSHKILHGTAMLGNKNNQTKLSEEDIYKIRELLSLKDGTRKTAGKRKIAAMFGVTRNAITNIEKGLSWFWLT